MTTPTPSHAALAPQVIHIDTHVHLHPMFDLDQALGAARRHMGQGPSVLLLTEMPGVDRFSELTGDLGDWWFEPSSEVCSVWATCATGGPVLIIAGHQVVTAEGLEVLVLGSRDPVAEGQNMMDTLTQSADLGAVSTLPWGVGKWTGGRGRIMAELAAAPPPVPHAYFADSGVRRRGSVRPALLGRAEAAGWRVLAGSDPLPFAFQTSAVGRYGNVVQGALDANTPFASLKSLLAALSASPQTYGQLHPNLSFLAVQVAMQVRKRLR
ncbi:MAG: hypothetical protein AAGK57_00345 [Pseudomonadota bacterium]